MTIHTLTAEQKKARLAPLASLRAYSLADVEETLGVTHRTLLTYVKTGHLKAVKIGGRWKVTEEELRRMTSEGTTGTNDKRKKPASNRKKPKPEAAA